MRAWLISGARHPKCEISGTLSPSDVDTFVRTERLVRELYGHWNSTSTNGELADPFSLRSHDLSVAVWWRFWVVMGRPESSGIPLTSPHQPAAVCDRRCFTHTRTSSPLKHYATRRDLSGPRGASSRWNSSSSQPIGGHRTSRPAQQELLLDDYFEAMVGFTQPFFITPCDGRKLR